MKLIRATLVAPMLAVLAGCMAVPVSPGYYEGGGGYYAPAPVQYAPAVFVGPTIGIGIYGGARGRGRGHRGR